MPRKDAADRSPVGAERLRGRRRTRSRPALPAPPRLVAHTKKLTPAPTTGRGGAPTAHRGATFVRSGGAGAGSVGHAPSIGASTVDAGSGPCRRPAPPE